jgi:hypothetical protein
MTLYDESDNLTDVEKAWLDQQPIEGTIYNCACHVMLLEYRPMLPIEREFSRLLPVIGFGKRMHRRAHIINALNRVLK